MTPADWRRTFRAPRPADRQAREDVDAEIAFHLDMRTEELIAAGVEPAEARRRAEREFGDVRRARADLVPPARRRERRTRVATALAELWVDIRYAIRGFRADPAFAAVAILTLGLAIGAATTMFSVVNAVLLRPLPVRSPERLAMLWTGAPGVDARGRPDYRTADAWRRRSASFEDMAVLDPVSMTRTGDEGAERIGVARISPDFFPLLGVRPARGRLFTEEEAEARQPVALLGHDVWRDRFGGAEDAIGATIRLDGRASRIIGVLPAEFHIPGLEADVWEPHTLFPDWEATGNEGVWFVIGRLGPGVTVERAEAEMNAIESALDERRPPSERGRRVSVVPLGRYVVGPGSRLALWMLAGAVTCVLLIAAANVVSLSLARGVGRAREFAVRATLGAGRGRIVRQLLAESVTLALLSAVLGSLLALGGIRLTRAFGPADLARLDQASLDPVVLGWTLAVSLITGTLIGLAPAWTTVRRTVRLSGPEGARGSSDGIATRRIRRGVVVAEFALAIVLLACAGLLVRSWLSLARVDPGFATERVLSMNISTTAFPDDDGRVAFYAVMLDRVEALPGVAHAGLIGELLTDADVELGLTVERSDAEAPERVSLRVDEVSDDLFATLGVPLHGGRFFSAEDGPGSPPVAIVNRTLADRLWPGRDPVGSRFKPGPRDSPAPWITVVGVVGDMHRRGLEVEPGPQLFVPLAQQPSGNEKLFVRTSVEDPLELAAAVRAAVRGVDARVPVYFVTTIEAELQSGLAQRRFQTSLLIGFSILAVVVAAIGIYGLVHCSVSARTREFAIRMAVGARSADVFRITMREGLGPSVAGLALGLVGALWAGRAVSGLLFGVTSADPWTFASVSLLLTAVGAAACYVPARRSMAVDPMTTLRHE